MDKPPRELIMTRKITVFHFIMRLLLMERICFLMGVFFLISKRAILQGKGGLHFEVILMPLKM